MPTARCTAFPEFVHALRRLSLAGAKLRRRAQLDHARTQRFSDNNTKSFFCALPDGRYLYIGTPDNTRQGTRYPLVLALSEDGFNYDKCYILSDDRYTRQYEGRWKSGDYGYPFAYIREGWIYVIVSRQKERMDALKCKISDLR